MNRETHGNSGYVAFKPRARLLKVIGGELISDDVVAVSELVKNAYDADASMVTISFEEVTGSTGTISILDDGHGMDVETLLTRWMQPAGSAKGRANSRRTRKGRRMLGEKGVGRFAADKLASKLELVSRQPRKKDELCVSFDWDRFDSDDNMLSDIKHKWQRRTAVEVTPHGTLLKLSGIRTRWTERMFRRLSTRLGRLLSPFEQDGGFKISIESDEFPEYSGELSKSLLKRAPYRIDAEFDGDALFSAKINGGRRVEHEWNGSGALRCGPVRVRLYAFDLETSALARLGPRTDVRAWLKAWTGISLYRDAFRLWPYGEPHDDWLRLDQRRVNNPVVRLSNNQLIGFVDIAADNNPELLDQTSREGLVHNRAFEDLRRFMYVVLQLLEAERQSVRHPDAENSVVSAEKTRRRNAELPDELVRLARKSNDRDITKRLEALAGTERTRRAEEVANRANLMDGYADLAALGHTTTALGKTISPILADLHASCANLQSQINGSGTRQIKTELRRLKAGLDKVSQRIEMIAPIEATGTRRRRTLHVRTELEAFSAMVAPLLAERNVDMSIDVPDDVLRLEMRPEALKRLLYTLTLNSLDWVGKAKNPLIRVEAEGRDRACTILLIDNGSGIAKEAAENVFNPRYSTKEGGSGMGLTVARSIVEQYSGSIEVVVDGRRKGACVRVVLPRKRARSK